MVQLKLESIVNENLFSRNYLEEKLVETSVWETDEELEEAFERGKQIYENNKDILPTLTNNEAQLEDIFIKPIFEEVLGHHFAVQETTSRTAKQPDYGFFENEEDMRQAFKNKGDKDFYQNTIAIGDAKAWDKDLDKKVDGRNIFDNKNPSFQIDYYLDETPPSWGILTNGRKWRLYYEEKSRGLDTYYEVDLVDIIEKDNFESFKYFYLLFRKEAFTPLGDSFLDELYQQSLKYSQKIGEDLEDNIYQALLWMAKGYFNMKSNDLEKTEENLEIVHENSLIFLYRLMFLFYADNNELIPSDLPGTYNDEYSFSKWVEDILWEVHQGDVSHGGGLYNHRLFRIFRLINEGSEELGIPQDDFYVPPYNGGLFDPEKHPFLSDKKIQDGYLAEVVELLAKADEGDKEEWLGGRIDYSDLSLRHIGGIYEGLLEYKLKIAEEDIVSEKEKGTLKWISVEEAKRDFEDYPEDRRAKEGEIYLATDKGERKATGSYYTPEYIVEYIVENTVEPTIEEKIESEDTAEEIREEILSTKILDPAMGSGHFLIDALDNIAAKLSEYAPVEEIEDEREIDWAKREVARNCIYGVDVNPLATELAKVSVWLNTLEKDKPLSFIDHHLKTGNSLIGADIHDLDKHPEKKSEENGQSSLTSFLGVNVTDRIKELLRVYKNIVDIVEEEAKDIKEEENLYQKFEEHPFKKKFELLANVYTSYFIDNEFSVEQYEELLKGFKEDPNKWEELLDSDWVKKAQKLAEDKDLFHWKLEFPEVFFDVENGAKKINPGFDCVIGNPPYVNVNQLEQSQINYLISNMYKTTLKRVDIFIPFIEKSLKILRDGGYHSFIIPYPFLSQDYAEKSRIELLNYNLIKIVDLTEYKVFPEAEVKNIIPVVENRKNKDYMKVVKQNEDPNEIKEIKGDVKSLNPLHFKNMFKHMYRLELNRQYLELKEKIDKLSFRLGYGLAASWGARGSPISEFHLEKKVNDKCKKLVKGKDLQRFHINYRGRWLLYDYDELYRPAFPELFENDKLMISKVTGPEGLIASVDKENYYTDDSICNCIKKTVLSNKSKTFLNRRKIEISKKQLDFIKNYQLKYISGILNSQLIRFYFKNYVGYELNVYPESIEYLPIKKGPDYKIENKIIKLVNQIREKKRKKHKEKNGFLDWIQTEWSINIEDLSLKTNLKEYWLFDFYEMLRIAKKNKSKINGDPSSRKFQELLKSEWQKSFDTINPLVEEIQELENEIDALVFKLYDLTEEEVEIVLDSVDTEDKVKEDIIEKFQELCED